MSDDFRPWRELRLRPATMADKPVLDLWDEDPDVVAATNDDHTGDSWLNGEDYWTHELQMQSDVYAYFIGEERHSQWHSDLQKNLPWRPVAALQIIDPYREPTHYWGDIEPNLRAIDIWIGAPEDRNRRVGELLMYKAIDKCFAEPDVTAIVIDPLNSNTRAHRFYQRLGFVPTHRQTFNNGEDDCLVHRFNREQWLAQERLR